MKLNFMMAPSPLCPPDAIVPLGKVGDSTAPSVHLLPFLVTFLNRVFTLVSKASAFLGLVRKMAIKCQMPLWLQGSNPHPNPKGLAFDHGAFKEIELFICCQQTCIDASNICPNCI
jgi:hypothetical protein